MLIVGAVIIVLTFIAIIKQYEVRLVLILSGTLMAAFAGDVLAAVRGFTSAMVSPMVWVICTVMGFAFVLKYTGCDAHLVHLLTKPLTKMQKALVPGAVIVTALINIPLVSAAGVAAAAGTILIPVLIAAGVHPVMAASAVMAGTFGAAMSPGFVHNGWIVNTTNRISEAISTGTLSDVGSQLGMINLGALEVAGVSSIGIMDVVAQAAPKTIVSILIAAISLTVVSIVLKENKGFVNINTTTGEGASSVANFKVNYLKAMVPIFPLALLIVGSSAVGIFQNEVTVPQAMLAGVVLALLVGWKNPQEGSRQFFDGMGKA